MAEYRLAWLEIAEAAYLTQLADVRVLIDARLDTLTEDPFAEVGTVYNERSDQYSVPLGDRGFLLFAVVTDPRVVIVARVVVW